VVDCRFETTERRHKAYAKWLEETDTAIAGVGRWEEMRQKRTPGRDKGFQL
jgi:hypothetical protein